MQDVDLTYAIGLKPEDAIKYFESKGYGITWDWHEMLEEAHARAFTVAKAMRTDILQDIHAELMKALDDGATYAEFKKALTPRLKAKGWWGEIVNQETGEIAVVGPHRLKTIYETNVQTSYMVGHYRQMMENADNRPWWMYRAVMDGRTRPAHAALNGLVFRYDDPFWDSHFPPSGFRCRCSVRALDDEGLAEKTGAGEAAVRSSVGPDADATLDPVEKPLTLDGSRMYQSAAVKTKDLTGREIAMAPDAGWSYNPGKAAPLWETSPGEMKIAPGQRTFADFDRPPAKEAAGAERLPSPGKLPSVKEVGREKFMSLVRESLGIPEGEIWRGVRAKNDDLAVLHMDQIEHLLLKEDGRERYIPYILPTLTDPYEVYLTAYEHGSRREFRKVYIGLFADKKRREDIVIILRLERDGALFWNAFEREKGKIDKLRKGELLYPDTP